MERFKLHVLWYILILMLWYILILMLWYILILMLWYILILTLWYILILMLWYILILMLPASDIRSSPTHRLYTTDDGLPSTFVKHTLQLPGGHIAISTDHGIAIYDGYQFHNNHLPDGLPDSYVKQLFLDQQNRLFAATDRGVAIAEAYHDRPPVAFTSIPFDPPDGIPRILGIHQSADGRIHLAGNNMIYHVTETIQLIMRNSLITSAETQG